MPEKNNFSSLDLIKSNKELIPYYLFTLILLLSSSIYNQPYHYTDLPRPLVNLLGLIFGFLLLVISINDIKEKLLPIRVIVLGVGFGLVPITYIAIFNNYESAQDLLISRFCSVFIIFSFMGIIRKVSKLISGKTLLGSGDLKLSAMGALWLGVKSSLLSLALAFLAAGLFSISQKLTKRVSPFKGYPFAPFISAGMWISWLFDPLLLWKTWLVLWSI